MNRGWLFAALFVCAAAVGGCKTSNPSPQYSDSQRAALPSYESIASQYNERIDLLQSVWARGVVSITFTNHNGNRQWEQGDCYLFVVRPDNISFTILKLGEQYVRLGCNDHEFWVMDMQEKTARIGEHAGGGARIDRFGLPVGPNELLTIFALAHIPEPEGTERVDWSEDGKLLVVSHATRSGTVRYSIDPITLLPESAELIDADTGVAIVRADFSNYLRTRVPNMGGFFPQVPGQIDIQELENGTDIKVTFGTPRGDKDIDPDNFDRAHLLDVLGPFQIEQQ